MLRQVRPLILAAAALTLAACQKQEAQATPAAPAKANVSSAEAKTAPPQSEASGEAFELKLTAPKTATADQPGELTIQIAARPGFKINAEYPHNFRPEKDSGVQFDQPKFDLAAGSKTACEKKAEDTCRLEAKVPFKATAKGEQKAAGIAAFSVCNDEVCLIEKVPLSATVLVN